MPQWRSIRKAAEELKTEDPHAAILEWRIRELWQRGKYPTQTTAKKRFT